MIVERGQGPAPKTGGIVGIVAWWRLAAAFLLAAASLWFITRNLDLADVTHSLQNARAGYALAALLVIVVTIGAKSLRWRLLFAQSWEAPAHGPLFWSLVLGQFVNLLLPLRLGEVARIYSLERLAATSKARTLSTLVVEKSLDTLMLLGIILGLLPAVFLPAFVNQRSIGLAGVAVVILAALFLVASNAGLALRFLRRAAARLPHRLGRPAERVVAAGLEGLLALRDRRALTLLLAASAGIAGISVLTPLLLFRALDLPLGLREAALLHVVLTLGSAPPSTPGKVLVFEGLVVVTLQGLGLTDKAVILGYAILYHLVVILPQVVFGSIAVMRTRWRWSVAP